ncbi:unnamed protein product [Phytophthora fragariaefolia]|uniref:Unnamed protein product n=1 Tax=Phytophthora fragariaefolia TaxID=1490495 RepID=A0A9W6WWR4_9STRA|nr:unnamed protein product [Phytophthora fragariaefolia]
MVMFATQLDSFDTFDLLPRCQGDSSHGPVDCSKLEDSSRLKIHCPLEDKIRGGGVMPLQRSVERLSGSVVDALLATRADSTERGLVVAQTTRPTRGALRDLRSPCLTKWAIWALRATRFPSEVRHGVDVTAERKV